MDARQRRRLVRKMLLEVCGDSVKNQKPLTAPEDERPDDLSALAKRVRTLRKGYAVRLTQAKLAAQIGIGRQAVSAIECARALPHRSTWRRIRELEVRYIAGMKMTEFLRRDVTEILKESCSAE